MHQFYTPDINQEIYTLSEEESKHCIRVLRLKAGNKVQLLDGNGGLFLAEIIDEHPKKCKVKIVSSSKSIKKKWSLHIAIAPTKNMDRLEWFVEKAIEIGIDTISLINCANSERTTIKPERLTKVAISAIKQSLNLFLPSINELESIKSFIHKHHSFEGQKFIAYCNESEIKKHLKDVYKINSDAIILIGPEGDFNDEEIKNAVDEGFIPISLGDNRLRTETAALYSCALINIVNSH